MQPKGNLRTGQPVVLGFHLVDEEHSKLDTLMMMMMMMMMMTTTTVVVMMMMTTTATAMIFHETAFKVWTVLN